MSRRTQVVWLSLVGSMTAVGGLLLAFPVGPAGASVGGDGRTLTPLVSTTSPVGIDSIFDTRAQRTSGRWKAIVIHHSGSANGSPASIEADHQARGSKGLGHHFVIGNGRGMDDGELHVAYRWLDQLPGHHALGKDADWFNRNSLSICLVGNGERQAFTPLQLARLRQLLSALSTQLDIPAEKIYLHSDIAKTPSPGKLFPTGWLREALTRTR
jgi:N-acetyl-anhydromuramyl-L-alanine amidase AmpD